MPDAPFDGDDADRVVLRVPTDAHYARVVRVATSAYAVRLGLPPASVEDLRLAVDEALVLLLGLDAGAAPDGWVVVSIDAEGGHPPVRIELRLDPAAAAEGRDGGALSRFLELIPAAVAVETVDAAAGRVTMRHPR